MSSTLARWYRFPLVVVAVFLLHACGGGGGGGGGDNPPVVPNADPTGYYTNSGTATVTAGSGATSVNITDLQGIIHNNRLLMLSAAQGLSYDGTLTVNGNNFTGTVTVYDNGAMRRTTTIRGTIAQGTTVSGTIAGTGAGGGTFVLNYADNNSEVAALARVENTSSLDAWQAQIGGGTTVGYEFNVSAGNVIHFDEIFSGVFSNCAMNGTITPQSNTNLYTVNVALTNCVDSAVDGATYTGLATTRQKNNPDDTLVWIATDGTYSIAAEFVR